MLYDDLIKLNSCVMSSHSWVQDLMCILVDWCVSLLAGMLYYQSSCICHRQIIYLTYSLYYHAHGTCSSYGYSRCSLRFRVFLTYIKFSAPTPHQHRLNLPITFSLLFPLKKCTECEFNVFMGIYTINFHVNNYGWAVCACCNTLRDGMGSGRGSW